MLLGFKQRGSKKEIWINAIHVKTVEPDGEKAARVVTIDGATTIIEETAIEAVEAFNRGMVTTNNGSSRT